jgi:AraC-like DNA-binding protein
MHNNCYPSYKHLTGNFPLGIIPILKQTDTEPHLHDFTELVIITKGEGVHFINEYEYPVTGGDVFVIHGSEKHGYKNTNKLQLLNIIFDQNRLGLPLSDLPRLAGYHALFSLEPEFRKQRKLNALFRLNVKDLSIAIKLVEKIQDEIEQKREGFECMAKAVFLELACFLSRQYADSDVADVRECLRLGTVFSFLEENFRKNISIKKLCQMAHMSESSLLRAFKQSTGLSPKQYISRLKIRHACELFRTTDLNITEVSFDCGFKDSNYFSRSFRSVTGLSPSAFKKTL